MGRPKKSGEQEAAAYLAYSKSNRSLSAAALTGLLEQQFATPVSSKTVRRWVERWGREVSQDTWDLDADFQWHRMGDYGLPWEASGFMLGMLSEVYAYNYRRVAEPSIVGLTPTFREALWWWRVHQAAPEIGSTVGAQGDIHALASQFVMRELAYEVLGSPLELADLDACLVLKPWLDDEHHQNYHKMVKGGVVQPFKGPDPEAVMDLLNKTSDPLSFEIPDWYLGAFPKDREHPELLQSQQLARLIERLQKQSQGGQQT